MAAACEECGIRTAELKKCARCLQVAYCSKGCQTAGWRQHKKSCRSQEEQQLSLDDIRTRVTTARVSEDSGDASEILRWASRMEDLVDGADHKTMLAVFQAFAIAYLRAKKFADAGQMYGRMAEANGRVGRYEDHVVGAVGAAGCFGEAGDMETSVFWLETAIRVAQEHGFGMLESNTCVTLASALKTQHRFADSVQELRRALSLVERIVKDAAPAQRKGRSFDSDNNPRDLEIMVLRELIHALAVVRDDVRCHGLGVTQDGGEEMEVLFSRLLERGGNKGGYLLYNHYLRGMIHADRTNWAEAADSFQKAVDVANKHPEVLLVNASELRYTRFALIMAVDMLEKAEKLAGRGGAPPLETIMSRVRNASDADDWEGVMACESRMEDLLGVVDERHHLEILNTFALANCNVGRFAKAAVLFKRHAALCARMERFRDQAWDFYRAGRCLVRLNDVGGAAALFRNARAVGAEHGFFNAECGACLGLGRLAAMDGRTAEAEELLRHAWTVLEFVEDPFERGGMDNDISFDLSALLLGTERYEDAGPLIRHLREVAGARADYDTRLHMVHAVALAVRFQARRGDVKQAVVEIRKWLQTIVVLVRHTVHAVALAVRFQARRGDVKQAVVEMQAYA
ncbi:hypothetical protein T484DRAFT_1832246 [Baffinella frigidus]|nr:hypothetical protein T484DRAFT_1832246 [Cryptophyta sp. CCMP2293]